MGDGFNGFYRSNDPTNSIKVLKEKAAKENNTKNIKKQKIHTHTKVYSIHTVYKYNTSPLVYNNMG